MSEIPIPKNGTLDPGVPDLAGRARPPNGIRRSRGLSTS